GDFYHPPRPPRHRLDAGQRPPDPADRSRVKSGHLHLSPTTLGFSAHTCDLFPAHLPLTQVGRERESRARSGPASCRSCACRSLSLHHPWLRLARLVPAIHAHTQPARMSAGTDTEAPGERKPQPRTLPMPCLPSEPGRGLSLASRRASSALP